MLASITSILPSGIGFGRGSGSEDRDRERQDRDREQRERDKERSQDKDHERASEIVEEVTPRAADNDGKLRENAVDEHGLKKRRERVPNETFIVVRPPPSVSNHPLNLQLQLVPPQTKERSASGVSTSSVLSTRPSGEYRTSDVAGETQSLRRVQSVRSNRSDQAASFYASSSSASMSSIASTTSTTSTAGRRMIVPLYNLSAHNVMTNTVLDAGTDAKVAKFHKRGLEILALAVLECVEVWPSYGRSGPGHVAFLNATNGASIGAGGGAGGQHPSDHDGLLVTPTSSAISLSSAGSYPPHPYPYPHPHAHHPGSPHIQQQKLASPGSSMVPTSAPSGPSTATAVYGATPNTPSSPSGAKRIFGKIFKKRESQMQSAGGGDASLQRSGSMAIEVRNPSNSDLRSSAAAGGGGPKTINGLTFGSLSKRRSMNVSSPTSSHFSATPAPAGVGVGGGGGSGKDQPQLQPAILGIHPTLSAPIVPPAGRPTRYVWIVRKWLKGTDNGLLGGVMRNVSSTIGGVGNLSSQQQQQLRGGGQGQGELGMEVRFEWVRGQSKRKAARKSGLGKRGSTSFSQEEQAANGGADGGLRARRSLIVDRSSDAKLENSRSRGRGTGRPATASGAAAAPFSSTSTPPRVSGESETRHSAEHGGASSHDSRTNSMTSAFSDEVHRRGGAIAEEGDEGEESDPEDSETPWTCSLVVSSIPSTAARLWEHEHIEQGHAHGFPLTKKDSRRSGLGHTAEASSSEADASASANPDKPPPVPPKPRPEVPGTLLRLKVGAISPAVHHPKVVAQLKVPYPLPDVEVTRGRVRRRVLTPAGVAVSRAETFSSSIERERDATAGGGDGNGRQRSRGVFGGGSGIFGNNGNANTSTGGRDEDEGLVLTAEEIKDVLSCTAFWVVVREGFGGVGKVTRKGDGWRLRG